MAKCGFCFRKFRSEQAVKGHLKACSRYKTIKSERSAALGSEPKAAAMPAAPPPVQLSPPIVGPDLTAPLADLVQAMHEFSTKRDAPQTLQQQRRQILQAAKVLVIDQYRTPLGQVTASLRGSAKLAIERELAPLLLEELPFEEVLEIAATIRDACYVPAFTRQAWEATRQRVEDERRHKKEVEEFAASRRADRRKSTLIEQAIGQARARCEARRIIGPHRLSLLVDIELRLTEFLAGSEPVPDAHAIIQTVLDARFAEAEAKQAAARAKADAQWHEDVEAVLVLGAVVGLVTLVLHYYPAQMVVIFVWIERTFGLTPGAEAATPTHNASETTPPDASADAHPRSTRRRKYPDTSPSPEPPWGKSVCGEPAHA